GAGAGEPGQNRPDGDAVLHRRGTVGQGRQVGGYQALCAGRTAVGSDFDRLALCHSTRRLVIAQQCPRARIVELSGAYPPFYWRSGRDAEAAWTGRANP
nr:hypothetical protein [Tanacetum cinerariifolium]